MDIYFKDSPLEQYVEQVLGEEDDKSVLAPNIFDRLLPTGEKEEELPCLPEQHEEQQQRSQLQQLIEGERVNVSLGPPLYGVLGTAACFLWGMWKQANKVWIGVSLGGSAVSLVACLVRFRQRYQLYWMHRTMRAFHRQSHAVSHALRDVAEVELITRGYTLPGALHPLPPVARLEESPQTCVPLRTLLLECAQHSVDIVDKAAQQTLKHASPSWVLVKAGLEQTRQEEWERWKVENEEGITLHRLRLEWFHAHRTRSAWLAMLTPTFGLVSVLKQVVRDIDNISRDLYPQSTIAPATTVPFVGRKTTPFARAASSTSALLNETRAKMYVCLTSEEEDPGLAMRWAAIGQTLRLAENEWQKAHMCLWASHPPPPSPIEDTKNPDEKDMEDIEVEENRPVEHGLWEAYTGKEKEDAVVAPPKATGPPPPPPDPIMLTSIPPERLAKHRAVREARIQKKKQQREQKHVKGVMMEELGEVLSRR